MELKPELKAIVKTMAVHMAKQRDRSQNIAKMCEYRGEEGRQCAVGCLIPDEIYSDFIEGSIGKVFTVPGAERKRVSDHLMTLAPPGMKEDSFVSFLAMTQAYHDGTKYSLTLAATAPDISDVVLAALIEKDLTAHIKQISKEEWFTCPT